MAVSSCAGLVGSATSAAVPKPEDFRLTIVIEGLPNGPSRLTSKSALGLPARDICVLLLLCPGTTSWLFDSCVLECAGGAVSSCGLIVLVPAAESELWPRAAGLFVSGAYWMLGLLSLLCWPCSASGCAGGRVDSCSGPSLRWSKSWSFGSSSMAACQSPGRRQEKRRGLARTRYRRGTAFSSTSPLGGRMEADGVNKAARQPGWGITEM